MLSCLLVVVHQPAQEDFFAKNEIKLMVALLIYLFDITIEGNKIPTMDMSRFGFGSIPPIEKVPFTISNKNLFV